MRFICRDKQFKCSVSFSSSFPQNFQEPESASERPLPAVIVTWTRLGGVNFKKQNQNTDQMSHITEESEDIHGEKLEEQYLLP